MAEGVLAIEASQRAASVAFRGAPGGAVHEVAVPAPDDAHDHLMASIDAAVRAGGRGPGDIGLPTSIQWTLPDGWSAAPHRYPTPARFDVQSIISYGYDHEVLLISELAVPATAAPGAVGVPPPSATTPAPC